MADFRFEIVVHIGVLGESGIWKKELNRVSYNGGAPKFDIRSWNEDHTKMTKGITMTPEEFEALRELVK